jgi:hypothetical protein
MPGKFANSLILLVGALGLAQNPLIKSYLASVIRHYQH